MHCEWAAQDGRQRGVDRFEVGPRGQFGECPVQPGDTGQPDPHGASDRS